MNNDRPALPEFGEYIAGVTYVPRVGVYAVVVGDLGLATLRTSRGYFLPGGGAEAGESVEETLRREVREECGYAVEPRQRLGETVEWFLAEHDGTYYRLHSLYFAATFVAKVTEWAEQDHTLVWLGLIEAVTSLRRQSQAWVVQQFLLDQAVG